MDDIFSSSPLSSSGSLPRMRGIVSEAMVMCASSPENIEILDPPDSCVPGDLVRFKGYDGTLYPMYQKIC